MIRIDNISKQNGHQIVFIEASAALQRGEKVGLVGANGTGKTTLFRLITGEDQPDEGQISLDRGVTIGYFSQDVGEMAGRGAVAEVMEKHRRELGGGPHDYNSNEHRKRMLDVARDNEAALATILTPAQLKRLPQIALQSQGPRGLHEPDVSSALKLTPEQRDQMNRISNVVNGRS